MYLFLQMIFYHNYNKNTLFSQILQNSLFWDILYFVSGDGTMLLDSSDRNYVVGLRKLYTSRTMLSYYLKQVLDNTTWLNNSLGG